MGKKNSVSARVMALILIAVMAIVYMPVLTDPTVHAASDKESVEEVTEKLPEKEVSGNKAKALADLKDELGIEDESNDTEETKDVEVLSASEADQTAPRQSKRLLLTKGKKLAATAKFGWFTVSGPNKSGYITISGKALPSGYTYVGIYVSDEHHDVRVDGDLEVSLSGSAAFTKKLNMKNFKVGYHTIYVVMSQGENSYYDYVNYVPTYIYKRASNSLKWYYTGKRYFKCYYGGSTYYSYSGEYLDVFMDYRKGRGKWSKKVYGPISTSSYTVSKKTGLKAGSTYYARMMYGKKFSYNGQNYVITGRQKGYASRAKKIKTAFKVPKIKKIKITGARTIVHKYRVHYANRIRYIKSTGRIISVTPLYHTYRYYYTKYKVNVYLKKKMGIAGVQIKTKAGTVQKNGNKRKYVARYSVSGKKKGKRIIVSVRCFRSKTYGGFSRWKKKRVKIR